MGIRKLNNKVVSLEDNLLKLSQFTIENDNKLAGLIKDVAESLHDDMKGSFMSEIEATKDSLLSELKSELDNELNVIKKDINKNTVDIETINDKLDNFKNDTTGKFELYKSTARSRVRQLVGKEDSVKYVLFYSPFISKIYSDIYNHFGVNNSESIKMKDSDLAISMAKSWKPSMKYLHNKLREYQNKQAKGILKEERSLALNKFLEETNGGNNIEI